MPFASTRRLRQAASVFLIGMAVASPASAHDALVSSNPSAGAHLSKLPAALDLRFNEKVLPMGAEIAVKSPDGQVLKRKPTVQDTLVSTPLKASSDGTYHVTWRVTSADGHPVSGTFDFTAAGLGKTAGSHHASSVSSAPSGLTTGPTSPTTNEPGDNEPGWIIGSVLVLSLALAGAWIFARRRVHDDPR